MKPHFSQFVFTLEPALEIERLGQPSKYDILRVEVGGRLLASAEIIQVGANHVRLPAAELDEGEVYGQILVSGLFEDRPKEHVGVEAQSLEFGQDEE